LYRTILLPLDGSVFSEHALPAAIEVARRSGAVLHLVHVYQPDEPWRDQEEFTPYRFEGQPAYDDIYESADRRLARRYLAWAARQAEERGARTETALLNGEDEVAPRIRRYADEVGADLVVMATHGRGALSRAWLGSVADRLVREVHRPVLLVHPPGEEVRPDFDAGVTLDHLLIPLDGSDEAEQVVPPAMELGEAMDSRFTLLTVIPVAIPLGVMNPELMVDERERAVTTGPEPNGPARAYLEGVAERLQREGLQVDVDVVVEGDVTAAILGEARRVGADAIAIATHGRSGLSRLVMGSVAGELVRKANVPVLVYRPEPRAWASSRARAGRRSG